MTDQSQNQSTPATSPSLFPIAEWFNASTKGLCEDAKAQIWAEVSSHYADAIEMHSEERISGEDAEQRALADLGSPKKARRAFRKVYLTDREAKAVMRCGPVKKTSLSTRILFCTLAAIGILAWTRLIERPGTGSRLDMFCYGATLLFLISAFMFSATIHFTKSIPTKLLAQCAYGSCLSLALVPLFVLKEQPFTEWSSLPLSKCLQIGLFLIVAIPMFLSMLIRGLSIYRKLRRREDKA